MKSIDRFMDKVSPEPNSGCWLWMGYCNSQGYGQFGVGSNKIEKAHRVSFKYFCGEIPNGMYVMHKCDNPTCVNPDHLRIGTPKENSLDRDEKGRGAKGIKNGKSILTEEIVKFIRSSPLSRRKLADQIGVKQQTIQSVRSGRNWSHV